MYINGLKQIRINAVSTNAFFRMRFSCFQRIAENLIINRKMEFNRIGTFRCYLIHHFLPESRSLVSNPVHPIYGELFLNCPNILCHVFRLSSYFQNFFA